MLQRPFRVWAVRLHLFRAYSGWTSTIRQLAATRLGRPGRILSWSGPVSLVSDVVLFVALIIVVYLNPRS